MIDNIPHCKANRFWTSRKYWKEAKFILHLAQLCFADTWCVHFCVIDGQKSLGARYMYLLLYQLRQILSVRYSSHHVRSYHSLCPIQCVHVIATVASHMVYHVIPCMVYHVIPGMVYHVIPCVVYHVIPCVVYHVIPCTVHMYTCDRVFM